MNWIIVLTAQAQGFFATTGVEHVVAGLLQYLARESTNDVLVFHQQDSFRSSWRGSLHTWTFYRFLVAFEVRQINLDGGATVRLAVDPDVAAALLHDSVNSRQTKTSTAAFDFRRKKRFEDSGFRLYTHPATSVAAREHDVAARR